MMMNDTDVYRIQNVSLISKVPFGACGGVSAAPPDGLLLQPTEPVPKRTEEAKKAAHGLHRCRDSTRSLEGGLSHNGKLPSVRQRLPAGHRLEQQWKQLETSHLNSNRQKQQVALYQHQVQHPMPRLQQHQQPGLKQLRLQQRKANLYSLRGRVMSPVRTCEKLQPGPPVQSSDVGSWTNCCSHSQALEAETAKCKPTIFTNSFNAAGTSKIQEATRQLSNLKQMNQACDVCTARPIESGLETSPVRCRGDSTGSSTAFNTKLKVLKHSNQRLRASMHSTAATARASAGSTTAAAAPAVYTAAVCHACDNASAACGVAAVKHGIKSSTAVLGACRAQEGVQPRSVHGASAQVVAAAVKTDISHGCSGQVVVAACAELDDPANADPVRKESPGSTDAAKGSKDGGQGVRMRPASPSCTGVIADLLQQALQVVADGNHVWLQQEEQNRQQLPECSVSPAEVSGSNADNSSKADGSPGVSADKSISRDSIHSAAEETDSSISFCMRDSSQQEHYSVQHSELQRHTQDEQPSDAQTFVRGLLQAGPHQPPHQPHQQEHQAPSSSPGCNWDRGSRIRTALFTTPKASNSIQGGDCEDGSSSAEATIAETQHQLQLLLNSYALRGPGSPTGHWSTNINRASSHGQLDHCRSDALCPVDDALSNSSFESSPGAVHTGDRATSAASTTGTVPVGAVELMWQAAEEGFLQMLDASSQQGAQQQSHQPTQQLQQRPPAVQQPWRPPGIASARINSKSRGSVSPSWQVGPSQQSASSGLQKQQRLKPDTSSSNSKFDGNAGSDSASFHVCHSPWRLSIPDSVEELQQELSSEALPQQPLGAVLQSNTASPVRSPNANYTVQQQPQMQCSASMSQELKFLHQSCSGEARQQQPLALHILTGTRAVTCSSSGYSMQQHSDAVSVPAPHQIFADELNQELALRVLQEWSYQTASSRWQRLLEGLEQGDSEVKQQVQAHSSGTSPRSQHMQRELQQLPTAGGNMVHACFHHWQQHVQQQTAASSIAEQQWSAYHQWRLAARSFRGWRSQALDGVLIAEMLEEQASDFARRWCIKKCLTAWRHRFMPAERARALLKEVNNASAEAFAAERTKRLLSHCMAGWTAAVVVGRSARCAAEQLLQNVWLQSVLADWALTASSSKELRRDVLAVWHQEVLQQQVHREYCIAADEFAAHTLLRKACRSWVVAWCRCASARVFAKQLQAKRQSAVLAALISNVRHQQPKRHLQQLAYECRRNKLLTLCLRFWRVWVGYKSLVRRTAAAIECAVRHRMLRQVVHCWREVIQYKIWQGQAWKTAESFYWCRLVARLFSSWHQVAHHQARLGELCSTAAAYHNRRLLSSTWCAWKYEAALSHRCRETVRLRQQRLLKVAFDCWWTDTVGSARVFEFQVSALVRLVTACFIAWYSCARHSRQLQVRLTSWQQGHHSRQQRKQQLMFDSWRQHVILLKQWRSHAPLLAAAYYQENLIKQAWNAWKQQLAQQQQQQPLQQQQPPLQQQQHMQLQFETAGQHQRLSQEPSVHLETHLPVQRNVLELTCAAQAEATQPSGAACGVIPSGHDEQAVAAQPGIHNLSSSQSPLALGDRLSLWQVQLDPCRLAEETDSRCPGESATVATAYVQHDIQMADTESWRDWQQQQQDQQLELLQLSVAAEHHATRLVNKCFHHWARLSSAAAAIMSAQAQLKHECQTELLQRHQHLQSALQQQQDRSLGRTFKFWLQQVYLKRSAAVGLRCYNQLLKAIVSWRAVVLEQKQQACRIQAAQSFQSCEVDASLISTSVTCVAAPYAEQQELDVSQAAVSAQDDASDHIGDNDVNTQVLVWTDDTKHMIYVDQSSGDAEHEILQHQQLKRAATGVIASF